MRATAIAQVGVRKLVRDDVIGKIKRRLGQRDLPCNHAAASIAHPWNGNVKFGVMAVGGIVDDHIEPMIAEKIVHNFGRQRPQHGNDAFAQNRGFDVARDEIGNMIHLVFISAWPV